MIVGPRLVSVKRAGMVLCGVYSHFSIACHNRGTKFKSLLIVSVIGQSARASQIGYAFATIPTSVVLDVSYVGLCYPFLSCFPYVVLIFPFHCLRLAPCCYLLDVCRDNVDGRLFAFVLVRALRCVMSWLLTIKTMNA